MIEEDRLIEKLRAVERLFDGATTEGERAAAANARERLRLRLSTMAHTEPPIEYKFTLSDSWSRRLFVALLRRHGIHPYRYGRQRHTTVMAKVPSHFVDETLWPEFLKLNELLRSYLDEVTNRVVTEGVFKDDSEAEVVAEPLELPGSQA